MAKISTLNIWMNGFLVGHWRKTRSGETFQYAPDWLLSEARRPLSLSMQFPPGNIPGLKEEIPPYVPKGVGSWKYAETGITTDDDGQQKPVLSSQFEDSDYRKFHDAIKEHRFVVTQELHPLLACG